jgi:fibronectin type 3 domain-containing protein
MKKLNQFLTFMSMLIAISFIAFNSMAQPPAPTGVTIQAKDTHRAIVRWTLAEGATEYKVLLSTDDVDFTTVATVGDDAIFAHIEDLLPSTEYFIHVVASNGDGDSAPVPIGLTTVTPELKLHFPLDALTGEGHVYEKIGGGSVAPAASSQLVIQDAETSGLGIPATRFVQDELDGIASWADITSFIVNNEINANLMSRTFSLWVKNENPSLYTVPLSIEKRTGMTIAFKNDSIYVMDKQRPGVPNNDPYMTIVGAPYGTSDWTLVTHVYDDPYTKLYLNGAHVATSEPGPWIFPAAWQVGTGDKNGEIGALRDPCAALQAFLQNTWDVGPRNFFSGSLAELKMYNSALSDEDILKEYLDVVAPPSPTGVMVQAKDTDRAIIRWSLAEGATGYKVYVSEDGENFTEAAEVGEQVFAQITGLKAGTEYTVHVVSKNEMAESLPVPTTVTTVTPALSIHIPLDVLADGTDVYEAISGQQVTPVGQLQILDAETSGLGVAATKFVQDELDGITSYANISSFIVGTEINDNLMSRTISLWLKNENPSAYTVPLSIEKRTGMTLAFKNDSIYLFTKHRPQFPAGTDWVADGVGFPFGSNEWTLVTYVYDDPVTHMYLNGQHVASSPGGEWIFPRAWQVESGGGDKNAEIGALRDPCAALVQYLGDTWDPGVRNTFDGSIANVKMYNSALSDEDILKEYLDVVAPPSPTGVMVQAKDTDRAIIRWSLAEGATGYKVYVSEDGENFTEAAEVGEQVFAQITGLKAGTEYTVHVVSKNEMAESLPVPTTVTTVTPALSIHIPLDVLADGTDVYEAISGQQVTPVGQLQILDAETSGLGVAATKFVQDELDGITSYANISSFIVGTEINDNLMSRTISLWLKNENPSAYTVPLSIEKRTGMTLAFKNDSIYLFTKHRPQFPAGTDWVADGVGFPFGSNEWTLVTYVYDDPVTHMYLNGQHVASSPGGEWIFPRAWQVESGGGDKNAEIGALRDPCAGLVQYLGDGWDPGVRHTFDGILANIKMYNHALSASEIMKEFTALAVVPEGFMVQSTSPNEVLLKWNAPENGLAYKVEYSTDGVEYNEVGETTAGEVVKRVTGLDANSEYHFRLTPVTSGLFASSVVATSTVEPAMVAQFNFSELAAGGTAIVENISGAEETFIGDFSIEAVEEHLVMGGKDYKLEVNALKIHQDELGGINSYVRLYQSLLAPYSLMA